MSKKRSRRILRNQTRYGTPGKSVAAERRRVLASYRALPLRTKTTGIALSGVLIGTLMYAQTGSWGTAVSAAAVMMLIVSSIAFIFSRPGVAATLIVLAGYTALVAGIAGATFMYAATDDPRQAVSGIVVAVLFGPLVALMAHLTSRGRPWLTTLLALTTAMILGLVMLFLIPALGFWWAVFLAGVVLFLRGGGWEWLLDTVSSVFDRFRPQRAPVSVMGSVLQAREDSAVRTADIFESLGSEWTVFHDVAAPTGKRHRLRREHDPVEHVVVGPGGAVVILSRVASGMLDDDPDYGVALDGAPVAPSMLRLSKLRDAVARALRLDPESVGAVMVFHGANIRNEGRMRVGLYNGQGEPYGETYAVNEATLIFEIENRPTLWSDAQVRRMVRKARAVLPPATTAGLTLTASRMTELDRTSPDSTVSNAHGSAMSHDGRPTSRPTEASTTTPLWFRSVNGDTPRPLIVNSDAAPETAVGQQVTLMTEEGMFSGMRVVSRPYTEGDVTLVRVCTESEWRTALDAQENVNGYPFPLASVHTD